MKRTLALATLAFAGILPCMSAQTLPTLGDTFFAPGNASNFSTSPTINVGGAGPYQGLIQFDMSGLPSGTTSVNIAKATIVLFVNKLGAAGTIDINAANGSWNESTVNGTNAPSPGVSVTSQLAVDTEDVYLTVDATALVKEWVAGTVPNSGIIISADPGSPNTSVLFDSKESSSTSHPAVLEVVLTSTGATGPKGPQGVPGVTGPAGPQGPQGPIGPAGVITYQRTTFAQNLSITTSSTYNGAAYPFATLSFTPTNSGTAVFFGRGYCLLESAGSSYIDTVYFVPATSYTQAYDLLTAGLLENLGVAYSGANIAYPAWTTETTQSVTANTPYTVTLYAMRPDVGGNKGESFDTCEGSLSVQIF